ncbi:MAG: RNA polymerase sigma-70 factor [Bacteroidales bacterium]|jgi:RNA polymerase sigma-70 factor (ECF subfamily)|nr:RNA polymerase sigma-70 factor [Bacteroidales bacterium]
MTGNKDISRRIRNGDIKAFEKLFRSSYNALVNYARTILKDTDTSEEIVQELFYVLWRDRKKIMINSSINAYLFRSVYNRCMHYIDHKKVVMRHEDEIRGNITKAGEDPSERMNYIELHEKVNRIIERLPERAAKIFCMSRFEGMKYSEIAKELSISVKTVEANMGKALKEFRKELSA